MLAYYSTYNYSLVIFVCVTIDDDDDDDDDINDANEIKFGEIIKMLFSFRLIMSLTDAECGAMDSVSLRSKSSEPETLDLDKTSTTTGVLDADSCHQSSPPLYAVDGSSCSQQQSYIALISMAILGSPNRRLVLSDIYRSLSVMIPSRYNNTSRAWRNSIRHNLSLNECFIKAGRSPNGKGMLMSYSLVYLANISRIMPQSWNETSNKKLNGIVVYPSLPVHSSGDWIHRVAICML